MDYRQMDPALPILYSLQSEGIGSCFSDDVIGPVTIGMDELAIGCPIESPCDPFAAKNWYRFLALLVGRQRITIQETGLAGVAFFGENHSDALLLGFVGEHLDQPGMGHLNKVLIRPFPQRDLLFPARVVTNHERSNPLSHQQINHKTRDGMQIMLNSPIAPDRQTLHAPGGSRTTKRLLEFCSPLVVKLIRTFQTAPVNDDRDKPRFI